MVKREREEHGKGGSESEAIIKWIGQLAAWEAHNLVPTFPSVLKKAYDPKPFFGSTDVHGRDTALH
jgi:hypothetical protein